MQSQDGVTGRQDATQDASQDATVAVHPVRWDLPDPLPVVMSVPEAGRVFFGKGETWSYDRMRDGLIPAIACGKSWVVPVSALLVKLGIPVPPARIQQVA